jgi:hypothetical protein
MPHRKEGGCGTRGDINLVVDMLNSDATRSWRLTRHLFVRIYAICGRNAPGTVILWVVFRRISFMDTIHRSWARHHIQVMRHQ